MKTRTASARKRAYILLEVMLAAGIFAMAGVGLVVALNDMAHSFTRARKVTAVRIELESRLSGIRIRPLAPGKSKDDPDPNGVVYEQEIAPLELSNDDKIALANLYRVTLKAHWKEGTVDQEEEAEIYVYQP
ncbi:MAG: hypothetical protein PHD76_06485 [Methylacidiphilales bacterium]|nr:hypothetical protein [Candidatus Methylacidiphilales bacterium]